MATVTLALPEAIKRASAAYDQGRLDEAEGFCRAVLGRKADNFNALHLLAAVQAKRGQYAEALANFDQALSVQPDNAEALTNRGNTLHLLKRDEEAISSYDRAIRARPDHAEAFNNRGIALKDLERFDEALASLDKALGLRPDFFKALYNRALVLTELKRFDEALAGYERARAIEPDHAEVNWNESLLRLRLGDYARGWPQFEYRWKTESFAPVRREFHQPLWRGADEIAGKTILLHSEQGYGDVIQFCRYVPMVAERGAHALLGVPGPLQELMSSLAGQAEVIVKKSALLDFDFQCPLLSLPLAFGTTLETIPSAIPYLSASPADVSKWAFRLAPRLGPKRGARVGLAWSGNPTHKNDENRSISLRALLPLLNTGATFVSLQKDVRAEDAMTLKERRDLIHFGDDLKSFSDTAALIAQLDLVISVDTAVAHLAGAMGKPVWVLLPHVPDWRWLLDRDDSPWYPTARLFRQDDTRAWEGVIGRVREALHEFSKRESKDQTLGMQETFGRAVAAFREDQLFEAERLCRSVLASKDDFYDALHLLAVVQSKLGHGEKALENFDRALALRPDLAEAHYNRGVTLKEMKRLDEALASLDRALAAQPDYPAALNNRGILLKELKRAEDSIESYNRALALRPDYAEALNNRGNALRELKRFDEALASYDSAQAARLEHAEAHWNEGLTRLLMGDFQRGWPKYEWRWKRDLFTSPRRDFRQPLWLGAEPIAGKTILLHAEQGYGDTIQFCRYASLAAARGARVLLEVQSSLRGLMESLAGNVEPIAKGEKLPDFEFQCPLLSLPLAFGTQLETIPSLVPYLRAPPADVRNWQARLGPKHGPRVGLAWSGSPTHRHDEQRTISLRALLPLLNTGATFVSLQKDVRAEDAMTLKERRDLIHFGDDLKSFSDTAALIAQLDLVISVDTAVAHLAGAMGKPVWVLLPHVPDWRWLLDRDDSPWYPTARLFRQDDTRAWEGVIKRVANALRAFAKHPREGRTLNISDARKRAFAAYKAENFSEAEKLCHAILTAKPGYFEVMHLLGVVQSRLGRKDEALASFDRALAIKPDHAEAHYNRGLVLQNLKRPEEALVSFERTLALAPDKADAYYSRGNVLRELKRFEEALASFDRALASRPDYPAALNNRGNALRALKRFEEALESYDRAIVLRPDYAAVLNNRGIALKELKRYGASIESYDRAIALQPDYAEAYNNRGNVLQELGRLEEALASFDRAIAIRPDYSGAFANRAIALKLLRRFEEALANYDRAIALSPNNAEPHLNRAICHLLLGDFERGWEEYEWRWETQQAAHEKRNYAQPSWRGTEKITGKTVLLYAEQGMGDTIQFSRYARLAAARGASVILQVQPSLKRLLSGLAGSQIVLSARGEPLPPFDLHCPLLSLPRAFGTRLETIPPVDPRVRVPVPLVEQWSKRLGPKTKPRVGIVWSGKATYRNDHNRSISLNEFLGLLKLPVEVVSLQKEVRDEDNAVLAAHRSGIAHHGPALTDFLETAALASLMDVVVSVDTAVAHLAATLGRPTWILLPHTPDWRWLLDREDSPWYPSARLFRQEHPGLWDDVMKRVVLELSRFVEEDAGQVPLKTAQAVKK